MQKNITTHMYRNFLKRITDLCLSLIALIILSPVFIIVYIILLIPNDGQPFFYQERPGFQGKPFRVIKFKSMNDAKDHNGNLLPNHMRTTKIGRILRNSSLDELPQLINVIRGDMSLVGPRPLLFKYIPLYSEEQKKRHLVKPGITGWAQVNGRNAISWKKKFELDVWYIENLSFLLDIKILWMTLLKWIKPEGVNAGDKITMPPFNGKN